MKVKIASGESVKVLRCTAPIEQMISQSGGVHRWILAFVIKDRISSDEIDSIFAAGDIQTLKFEAEDENETEWVMTGYTSLNSAVIRRDESGGTSAEIQLIKAGAEEEI